MPYKRLISERCYGSARHLWHDIYSRLEWRKGKSLKLRTNESINERIRNRRARPAGQPSEFHHAHIRQIGALRKIWFHASKARARAIHAMWQRGGEGDWVHFAGLYARVTFLYAFCVRCACYVRGWTVGAYSRGVGNIRAPATPAVSLYLQRRGIMELLFQCANIYSRGYRSRYNFWDDMHAMFGAPGADSRAFCRPREMITLKNARGNPPLFFLLPPTFASSPHKESAPIA